MDVLPGLGLIGGWKAYCYVQISMSICNLSSKEYYGGETQFAGWGLQPSVDE